MTDRRSMAPLLLLAVAILFAAGLRWVIPSGQYDRSLDSQTGGMQVVPGSYKPVPPNHWRIPGFTGEAA